MTQFEKKIIIKKVNELSFKTGFDKEELMTEALYIYGLARSSYDKKKGTKFTTHLYGELRRLNDYVFFNKKHIDAIMYEGTELDRVPGTSSQERELEQKWKIENLKDNLSTFARRYLDLILEEGRKILPPEAGRLLGISENLARKYFKEIKIAWNC